MSGHSKWAQIKRQKGANDAKRGQMFTKLAREITVAARQGGGDPETNFRLRLATQRARSMNMPQENITRAVARATGGADGAAQLEEVTYEGYGPGGVAIFVEALTDNRNRTVAEVRNVLTRNGGSLGENGSVAWIFEPRGIVLVNLDTNDADEVTLQAIDAGATDVNLADKTLEIYTNLENLEDVRRTMEDAGLEVETAERTFVPKTMVTLDDQKSTQVVRLIERLEDLDDVQNVSANLDLSEELVAQLAS
ncbi:MAG TPA: YebC/PmpR family DNA-binding transcriptional regulator [Chloroflexota bacterium]|jgi:YebC/PmpR family DNA-binding regulatory protein|nr:YebC/PmpR family DNA-binding transcriptional regulator [Chloroflexota bacterium]